jgi:glycosyltransferase involved in cell wall biosynthesis
MLLSGEPQITGNTETNQFIPYPTKKVKVCMVAYAYYLNDARIKSYVRTLEDQGHSVDVIALKADGESAVEQHAAGTIFRLMGKYQGQSTLMYAWSYLRFLLKSSLFLARRCFRQQYDVVHVHNMPNALVFATIAPKVAGARILLDVHDLMTAIYMTKFNSAETSLPVGVLKLEQRISAMFADHVVCADHNQQDYLVEHCGIARPKTTVLMNLPNVELFKAISKVKRDGLFRIVYHGTIAHRLGIDLIVKAMAKIADRIPAQLWIYGTGDYLPEVLALASKLRLEEKIHFSRTFFPVERIPNMVCGMDLGIIGNRCNVACDRYMLPVKLLEYVYLGVPVVVPRLKVIARYFDDTMVQFYEPENVDQLADAVVELFHDREKRERLTRGASSFYQKHNIAARAKQYLALLTASSVSLSGR